MWPISNLIKKYQDWRENHAFETEMAGKPYLSLWHILLDPIINFYLLHWKWIWTTATAGVIAYAALAC